MGSALYTLVYVNDLCFILQVYMLTIDPMTGDRQAFLFELALTLGLLPSTGAEFRFKNFIQKIQINQKRNLRSVVLVQSPES